MNELMYAMYILVGFLIAIWRMSKVSSREDSSMACIGGLYILFFWPLYLVYKVIKKYTGKS